MRDEPFRSRSGTMPCDRLDDHDRRALELHTRRIRTARIAGAAWAVGTVIITVLFVRDEWNANGAFRHIGNAGNPGDWNPTLWAVLVGALSLTAGIIRLRAWLECPVSPAEVDREVTRRAVGGEGSTPGSRQDARRRLEGMRRIRFHLAAWALGLVILTPVWLLIEWQDNGPFQRWSGDSQPGSWDPWILPVAAIWLLAITAIALRVRFTRHEDRRGAPTPGARPDQAP